MWITVFRIWSFDWVHHFRIIFVILVRATTFSMSDRHDPCNAKFNSERRDVNSFFYDVGNLEKAGDTLQHASVTIYVALLATYGWALIPGDILDFPQSLHDTRAY
jgi:hypothetical protein